MQELDDPNALNEVLSQATSAALHSAACTPQKLADHIADQSPRWPHLELRTFMPLGECAFVLRMGGRLRTLFPGGVMRDAVNDGRAEIMDDTLFEHAMKYSQGVMGADVVLLQVSPAGSDGKVALGPSVDIMPDVIASANTVVATINRHIPRCGPEVALCDIDFVYRDDASLPELLPARADEIDRMIAANVARLIGNDATLETGIGAVPEAVLVAVAVRSGLRIHTGLINDGIMEYCRQQSTPVTACMAAGSARFYRWLDENSNISLRPASFTHSPETLAGLTNFHAVNGALQVDLSGSVNTEIVGGRVVSARGGLPDFAKAAHIASDGKSIVALRSTIRKSGKSTIVPRVEKQSLDGEWCDYVVTEHGIAELAGKTAVERANAIASIADPTVRNALRSYIDFA